MRELFPRMGFPKKLGRMLLVRFAKPILCFIALALVPRAFAAEPEARRGFVYVEGAQLKLNGGDFRFSGANSFSMLYSEFEADAQFSVASKLGLNAIRLWGFWDGEEVCRSSNESECDASWAAPDTDRFGHYVLQSRPRVYPEPAWRRLDYVVHLARLSGIKLIIPFLNQWPEFGGIDAYLGWVGVDVPARTGPHYEREAAAKAKRSRFFENEEAKAIFFDYIEHMLNRVNTLTGVAYKDEPAIMIWEVMNEPRYGKWEGDPSGEVVRSFIREVASFIKSIDKNHLVATGEEGFLDDKDSDLGRTAYPWVAAKGEGVSFAKNAGIPEIDVLGFHCWPFQWNLWGTSDEDINDDMLGEYPDIAEFPKEWIAEHARIAAEAGKPLYLGEFGFQVLRAPGSNLEDRDRIMRAAYDAAKDANLAGIAFWHLTGSHDPESAAYKGPMDRETLLQGQYGDDPLPHDLDFRFDVFCPEDESTCQIISEYSSRAVSEVDNPDPPYYPPCLPPWKRCGASCVLKASHPDHCGACGASCEMDSACRNGRCLPISR